MELKPAQTEDAADTQQLPNGKSGSEAVLHSVPNGCVGPFCSNGIHGNNIFFILKPLNL